MGERREMRCWDSNLEGGREVRWDELKSRWKFVVFLQTRYHLPSICKWCEALMRSKNGIILMSIRLELNSWIVMRLTSLCLFVIPEFCTLKTQRVLERVCDIFPESLGVGECRGEWELRRKDRLVLYRRVKWKYESQFSGARIMLNDHPWTLALPESC